MTRTEPTSTTEALKRIDALLARVFGLDSIRQCDKCGCMFIITNEGPYVWIDRYAHVENSHAGECPCHSLQNGQDFHG
jgi:hypothetical protein